MCSVVAIEAFSEVLDTKLCMVLVGRPDLILVLMLALDLYVWLIQLGTTSYKAMATQICFVKILTTREKYRQLKSLPCTKHLVDIGVEMKVKYFNHLVQVEIIQLWKYLGKFNFSPLSYWLN